MGRRFQPQVEHLEDRWAMAFFNPLPATVDGAADSLRADIITANGNNASDFILLQQGKYSLTVPNDAGNLQENASAKGDLDITEANKTLTIEGQGAGVTIIDAAGLNDRVFHILTNARVILRNLTVSGGLALEQGTTGQQNGAARGGGIFNSNGDLTLENVIVENNEARGRPDTASNGEGGGVHSTGPLVIISSVIRNNKADGATGLAGSFSTAVGAFIAVPGGQGLAGGLLVTSNSTAVVRNTTISGNSSTGGTGGLGGTGDASFMGGVGGPGGTGGAGRGGGIGVRNNSNLTLINSTISSNTVTGGVGGVGGPGLNTAAQGNGGNGGNGEGGGISVDASTLNIFSSTVAANQTATNVGGTGTVAGSPGLRRGSGLMTVDDSIATVNSTSSLFADNSAVGKDVADLADDAGAVFDSAVNTLVETSVGTLGLANDDANHNKLGVDPKLGPLASNGGPTQTHALKFGSVALDAGANPLGLGVDQRGLNRNVRTLDIGAFEKQAGKVTITTVNGRLVITGSAIADEFRLELASGGPNRVRVVSLGGTLINGTATAKVFTGITKGITVKLGSGDDRLEVKGGAMPGEVTIDGGDGVDTFAISTNKTKIRIVRK
jgi:hypothetical protein